MQQTKSLKSLVKYHRLVPNEKYPNTSMSEMDHNWKNKFIFTYCKFEYYNVASPVEFYEILINTEDKRRNYYESIKERWQKLHFDLDMHAEDMNQATLEYAELVKNYVVRAIKEYFDENVTDQPLIIENDILVFNTPCSTNQKFSYHIVVDNFAFPSSAHCLNVTKKVITKMPDEMKKFIDTNVNRRNQQFRTWKSCKENEKECRYKELQLQWMYFGEKIIWKPRYHNDVRWQTPEYIEYLVFERTLVGYFGYSPFIVNFEVPKLRCFNGVNLDPPKVNLDEAKKLVPAGWHITNSYEDTFDIEPDTPLIECLVCKSVHDIPAPIQFADNSSIRSKLDLLKNTSLLQQHVEISGGKQEVLMRCSKDITKCYLLGTLNPSYIQSAEIDVEALKAKIPTDWYLTGIHGTSFGLRPLSRDVECLLCKRKHDKENQWITVCGEKQAVFFKCRRADDEAKSKRSLYLGELKPEAIISDAERARSIEYRNNKPQIETDDNYCEKHVKPINTIIGVILLLCSFMGTGKTTEFNNYVRRHNPKRVCVLSPRILYTESITSEYNQPQSKENPHMLPFIGKKFKTYLETTESGKKKDFNNCDRLVIQMESIHNLMDVARFDVLILDEIESLFQQFGSSTMKEQILCTQMFERLIRETPIIIGGDAFLSQKSIKTLEKLNPNIHITRNDFKPLKRTAFLYPTIESLFYRAYYSLSLKKKIVFFCASREKALEFASGCKDRGIIYKLYVGKSNTVEQDRAELRNVNESWSGKVQCIIYNSRITVGVNYNIKDEFDQLFVYGSSHSCCVRDTFQGTLRVRHIKDEEMYVNIYDKSKNNRLPLKEIDVRNHIETLKIAKEQLLKDDKPSILTLVEEVHENVLMKYQNVNPTPNFNIPDTTNPIKALKLARDEIISKMQSEGIEVITIIPSKPFVMGGQTYKSDPEIIVDNVKIDEYIKNNIVAKVPVQTKTKTKTREYIAQTIWKYAPEWLKICLIYNIMEENLSKVCYRSEFEKYLVRCNYKIEEKAIGKDEYCKGGTVAKEALRYSEIPDIISGKEIRQKLNAGLGTLLDHQMLEKYNYNKLIDNEFSLEKREELFNKFHVSEKLNKFHFINRYDEKYETPDSLARRYVNSKYIESAPMRASKLQLVNTLNSIFGIQNSAQGFRVHEQLFTNIAPHFLPYVPEMQKLFNARSEDKDPTAQLIKNLDTVYKNWAGTGIVRVSKRKQANNIKYTEYTISKDHDQSVEEAVKPRPVKGQFKPDTNVQYKQYCPVKSEILNWMINYGISVNTKITGKELANAIRRFGYLNALNRYQIPSNEIKTYLTSQGISDNENFISVSSTHDNIGLDQVEGLLNTCKVVTMT